MSIELSRRVKQLEAQMAELARQIAELRPRQGEESFVVPPAEIPPAETHSEPVKRKRGRPRKNV